MHCNIMGLDGVLKLCPDQIYISKYSYYKVQINNMFLVWQFPQNLNLAVWLLCAYF